MNAPLIFASVALALAISHLSPSTLATIRIYITPASLNGPPLRLAIMPSPRIGTTASLVYTSGSHFSETSFPPRGTIAVAVDAADTTIPPPAPVDDLQFFNDHAFFEHRTDPIKDFASLEHRADPLNDHVFLTHRTGSLNDLASLTLRASPSPPQLSDLNTFNGHAFLTHRADPSPAPLNDFKVRHNKQTN